MTTVPDVTFELPLLQAISDWQRGDENRERGGLLGRQLKAACVNLPDRFKACDSMCYRRMLLDKRGQWKLLAENELGEKISSWTMDLEVAKGMKGGIPDESDAQAGRATIFQMTPPSGSVITNLAALYADPKFCAAMTANSAAIINFDEGAASYWDIEQEVVIEIDTIAQADIYSMGGESHDFDTLVLTAAFLAYGPAMSQAQWDEFRVHAESIRHEAGKKWLAPDAFRRVLARVQQHVPRLLERKRAQNAASDAQREG